MRCAVLFFYVVFFAVCVQAQPLKSHDTYCNPLDISYRFRPENNEVSYREAADPSALLFKGKYYLFASKSGGYWCSENLLQWNFISSTGLPSEDYAPAVIAIGDTLYFAASSGEKRPLFKTANPESGVWEVANREFPFPIWDPAFFQDDDGRLYLYWGCSPKNPLYGVELDLTNHLNPIGEPQALISSNVKEHGWECFGENNDQEEAPCWLEGAWMNKYKGKYYLQFAVPGTQLRTYADGYYISDYPMGPFTYSPNSPFCRRTGGFATGIGHSCTFPDKSGNYWHATTMAISVKHMFERRLCLFPAAFDNYGELFTQTAYGDYPHYIPSKKRDLSTHSDFTGWMLLSYNKPVRTSSQSAGYEPEKSVDENIKTWWAAQSGQNEWLEVDLQKESRINALQINFADHETSLYGRNESIYYQYKIESSQDGKNWNLLIDQCKSLEDRPHAYFPVEKEIMARYLKLTVYKVPDGKIAVSGFRIFGKTPGKSPRRVSGLMVKRDVTDEREAFVSWTPLENIQGYVLRYGVHPDKLYQSVMLYGQNEITLKSLDKGVDYYFSVEGFNASGIGAKCEIRKASSVEN